MLTRPAVDAMSSSNRILAGLGAGILVGLFLGERAGALKLAADGFVKLLQMTVLPYVTVSIVGSLGRLRYQEARTLAVRTGGVLIGLWLLALLFTFLIPLTFPRVQNATFFSTTLVERASPRSTSSTSTSRRTRFTRWPTTSCPRWCCSRSCSG